MSESSDFLRIKQIVLEASDLPADQREAFVLSACAGDASMLAEVRALLKAQDEASGAEFMGESGLDQTVHPLDRPLQTTAEPEAAEIREGPGERIGPYKLLQIIGEGGFGSVFMAEQERPVVRRVALKIIKLGMDTRAVIARFEAERQALAIMDHAHIARVLDAGTTTTGRPYFVMELVKGEPITEYADRNHLNIAERIELFGQVCNAVQHAHQKGIIHRDIKPTNVLVSTQDDKPFAKVIDFGIAKAMAARLTEKTVFTEFKQMIGTPQYMSPEQAEGTLDIDTRTDVYSLGVLLYELLTGQTPFDAKSLRSAAYEEMRRIIREVDPPKPSTKLSESTETLPSIAAQRKIEPRKLTLEVRGELDWIVMRALEKDRGRRYPTPNDLAADLQRHLAGEPVEAAPPSLAYRAKKFTLRYRAAIVTFGALLILLLAAVFGTSFGLVREHKALAVAEVNRKEAVNEGQRATEQARLALAAKADAEQQAKLAKKSALLSDTRYLLQQSQTPQALDRARQADALDLTYDERLIFNDIVKASRTTWQCIDIATTGSRPQRGCFAVVNGNDVLVTATGSRLEFCERGSKTRFGIDLPNTPTQLLGLRSDPSLVAVTVGQELRIIASASGTLMSSKTFDSPITKSSVSNKSILVGLQDGQAVLIDLASMKELGRWTCDELKRPWDFNPSHRATEVSPDDRFILLHEGAWNDPTMVIDRQKNTVRTTMIRFGVLSWDEQNPTQCVTLFGGLMDEICRYDLERLSMYPISTTRVKNDDIKEPLALQVVGSDHLCLGQLGVNLQIEEFPDNALRYDRLLPLPGEEPKLLATDQNSTMFALSAKHGWAVFARDTVPLLNFSIGNWNSCSSARSLIALNDERVIYVRPFKTGEPGLAIWPQLLADKGGFWIPWGFCVTPDEREAALVEQQCDSEGGTISDHYGPRLLLLYDLGAGIDKPQSWHIKRQIALPELAGRYGFANRYVRISPDGKSLIYCVDSTLYRFDFATGRQLEITKFDDAPEVSADSSLMVGHVVHQRGLVVSRVSDGSTVCKIAGVTQMRGACFRDDNQQLLLSRGGGKIEAFDLSNGQPLWKRPSPLAPRAWSAATGYFLGLAAESGGSAGEKLMLADTATGQPLATISPFCDLACDVAFRENGTMLCFQRDRWNAEIVRMMQLSDVMTVLGSPLLPSQSVHCDVNPAAAQLPPDGLPGGSIDASNVTQLQKSLNREVTAGGVVDHSIATASESVTLMLKPGDAGLVIYVSNDVVTAVGGNVDHFMELVAGKRVCVEGDVVSYGGHDPTLNGRPQITVIDVHHFQLLDQPTTRASP